MLKRAVPPWNYRFITMSAAVRIVVHDLIVTILTLIVSVVAKYLSILLRPLVR